MNRQMPSKPKTMEEQISILWDITSNHVLTSLKFQDLKCNFLLLLTALNLTLIGITLSVVLSAR